MSKLESALAIDFARRGALGIPLVLACMIVIPLWLLTALGASTLSSGSSEGVTLHATLMLMTGFVAAVAIIHAQGKLARFYVRPISTARLVGWQLLLGTSTIALLYVGSTAWLNVAGADWPVLGPALFLATALACALAAIWSLEGNVIGQFLGCTATSIPLVFWLSRCYGARAVLDWQVMWRNPTAAEALTLGAISLGAYVCAVIGVARTRRGDFWDFAALKAWWDRFCASGPPARAFVTPWAAQVWCEWREKMGLAPACILGCASFLVLSAWTSNLMPTQELLEFMVGMPLVLLMVITPLIFGLLAGNCSREGLIGMKHMLVTRPVTDSFLATAILRICTLGLTWAFVTWVVSLGLIAGLVCLSGQSAAVWNMLRPESFDNLNPVLVCLSVPVISWTVNACMAGLIATGRQWLWVGTIFGLFGLGLVAYVIRLLVTPQAFEILTVIWLVLSGGICAAGTVLAYVAAARLGMVSVLTIASAATAWLVLSIGLISLAGTESHQIFLLVHAVGLLSLAVLPFAAVPLAVRWNRHR